MSPFKLLLATRNRDKVAEIKQALEDLDIEIISLTDIAGLPEVEEDQDSLMGNAIKKASIVSKVSGLPALADDTGLEVDALDGKPGVYSSRYAGANASYEDNVNRLLQKMGGVAPDRRVARFRCVMALAHNGKVETVEGCCEGTILTEKRGRKGFGYDPVFFVSQYGQTFAEMDLLQKNKISHRGLALAKMKALLRQKLHW